MFYFVKGNFFHTFFNLFEYDFLNFILFWGNINFMFKNLNAISYLDMRFFVIFVIYKNESLQKFNEVLLKSNEYNYYAHR